MLRLWLLLTTNQNFLVLPANTATSGKFDPVPGQGDTIQNWDDPKVGLCPALVAQGGDPKGTFTSANLQAYLTGPMQKGQIVDATGKVVTDGNGHPITYAMVLMFACQVFQATWPAFVDWPTPSPKTIGETIA